MNNWEQISSVDPLFGVASAEDKRGKKWDEDEFFKVGESIVNRFIEVGKKYGFPKQYLKALDFGCGAGRLLRYSSKHFKNVVGVDISKGMIDLARRYNGDQGNITYHVNSEANLNFIESRSMDLVYTFHVLQHVPAKKDRISHLNEFQRILKKDGLLAFHIPTYIPFKNRIQVRRRFFNILNALGINSTFLIHKLGLYPIHMKSLSNQEILKLFDDGFRLLEKIEHIHKNGQISITFYYTKML